MFQIRNASVADFDSLCDIDNDASALFVAAGLDLESADAYEFERAERECWLKCLAAGSGWLAIDPNNQPVGFAAMSLLDGEPYLQQISVRTRFMRRGIGRSLIARITQAALEASHSRLWLTTYTHLPWNRPFYERFGWVLVPEHGCRPELRAVFDHEQRWLPQPENRVVMCKRLSGLRCPHPPEPGGTGRRIT
jgi:GNAT superfamily N-acetyltransferase